MKRRSVVFHIVLACLAAFGCTASKKNTIQVFGDVKNLGTSPLCISYYNEDKELSYDTVYSNRTGRFEFELHSYNEILPITIYFSRRKCWTTLFAQPGNIVSIRGNIELVDMLNITGGKVNDDLSQYKKQISKLYKDRLAILNGMYATKEESEEHLAEINLQLKRSAKEYIKEHPSSISSVVLIQDFFYQDYDPSTKALLELLQGDAKDFHLTKRIREGINSW